MSRRLIVPLLALLCLLSGCSAWRNDDYLSLSPHSSATTQTASPDAVTVENYLGLKNAILGFIREGQANGTIRVTNYDGDVEADLSEAAYEVSKLDPLGAYAVDYMTHHLVRIVSYYEIHISITFRGGDCRHRARVHRGTAPEQAPRGHRPLRQPPHRAHEQLPGAGYPGHGG